MRNVRLEKGSVIIDKNIQEKMYIKKWIKIENVSHQRIFLSVLSTYFVVLLSLFYPFSFFLEERGFISWFTTPEEQTHVGILFVVGKRDSRRKSVSICCSDITTKIANGSVFQISDLQVRASSHFQLNQPTRCSNFSSLLLVV